MEILLTRIFFIQVPWLMHCKKQLWDYSFKKVQKSFMELRSSIYVVVHLYEDVLNAKIMR